MQVLKVLAIVSVAATMALALAHPLELPGKMRLGKEPYIDVQRIYYPGFAIGGFAESLALLLTLILLLLTPGHTSTF